MMAEPVQWEFKVEGADQAKRDLAEIKNELGGIEGSTDSASAGASNFGANLGGMVVAAQAAIAAVKELVASAKELAVEYERQSGIMNRFSGDISEAATRTRGLTSDLDLMIASNKTLAAGLELSGHEFANIAVAANEFAAATGGDATQAMEALAQAIATGRQGQLRKFGIDLTGITGLTNQQTEAMRQLNEKWGESESSADTLGGELLNLDVTLENLKTEVISVINDSDALEESFAGVKVATSDLIEQLDKLNQSFGGNDFATEFENRIIAVTASVAGMVSQLEYLANGMDALFDFRWGEAIEQFSRAGNFGQLAEDVVASSIASRENIASARRRSNKGEQASEDLGEEDAVPTGSSFDLSAGGFRSTADAAGFRERRGRGGRGGGGGGPSEGDLFSTFEGSRVGSHEDESEVDLNANARELRAEQVERELKAVQELDRATREANEAALAGDRKRIDNLKLMQEQMREQERVTKGLVDVGVQGFNTLADAFGVTEGPKQAIMGIIETAKAVGSYPDPVGIASHGLAAATHFLAAAQLGFSAPSTPASGGVPGGTGAARPESVPGGTGSGGGEGSIVTINYNAPKAEALVGRDTRRAMRAAERQGL